MNHKSNLEQRGGGSTVDTAIHAGLPPFRTATFIPDYGIEYTKASHSLTPLGWVVAIVCVIGFAIGAYRHF